MRDNSPDTPNDISQPCRVSEAHASIIHKLAMRSMRKVKDEKDALWPRRVRPVRTKTCELTS